MKNMDINTIAKVLICFLFSCNLFAQTPKQDFARAEELYKKGNFTEAVAQTERVKKSLGRSNPKVEALLFMGYYNTQDYTKAKIAYETLKRMVPENVENSSEFALYKSTGEQLDKKLAEIQTAFEKKQNQGSKSLYDASKYEARNDGKQKRIELNDERFEERMAKVRKNNEDEARTVLEQILRNPTKQKFEEYLLEERYESEFKYVKKYIKFWDVDTFSLWFKENDDAEDKEKYNNLQYYLNLKKLSLGGNKIKRIPEGIFDSGKLLSLSAIDTEITSISEKIKNCKNLKKLYFQSNSRLKDFPTDISTLSDLEELTIIGNKFNYLPNIRGLNNLKILVINMALPEFPTQVLYLRQLEILRIMSVGSRNPFELHEHIELLSNLRRLDLRHSYVTELPKSIENLKNLEILGLYNTPIEDLPSQLKNLTKLKTIEIGGTDFKPYLNKKVNRTLKKIAKENPNLKLEYN